MSSKTIPNTTVTAVHIHKPGGVRTVEIKCPHCPKTHTHGWPLDDPEGTPIGHRVAHCSDGNQNPGYYIVLPDEPPC